MRAASLGPIAHGAKVRVVGESDFGLIVVEGDCEMTLLVALIFATWFLVFCELLLPGRYSWACGFWSGSYAVWHSYQLFGALVASLLGLGLF